MQDQAPSNAQQQSLATWLARRAPLSNEAVLEIALPLAAVVSAAHVEGRYDGTLTLERVALITGAKGGPPQVRIEPPGDAPSSERLTVFVSPEQVRGAPADEQTDQYSLAVIVWTLLAGRVPFAAHDEDALAEEIVAGVAGVATVRANLSPAFARVIDRATSLDPMRRYTSVRALGDALAELASPDLAAIWLPSFDRPSLEPRSVKERRDATGPVERPRVIEPPPLVRGGSVLGGLALIVVVAVAIVLWAALAGRG